jgi:CdiI immunity protein
MSKHKIVQPKVQKSELHQFASWFHQDWKLLFKNFHDGAAIYFASLPPERRAKLRLELIVFLDDHREKSIEGLKRSWLKSGAQGWQADLDIRATLGEFVRML